jgi:hypothetical protein
MPLGDRSNRITVPGGFHYQPFGVSQVGRIGLLEGSDDAENMQGR